MHRGLPLGRFHKYETPLGGRSSPLREEKRRDVYSIFLISTCYTRNEIPNANAVQITSRVITNTDININL